MVYGLTYARHHDAVVASKRSMSIVTLISLSLSRPTCSPNTFKRTRNDRRDGDCTAGQEEGQHLEEGKVSTVVAKTNDLEEEEGCQEGADGDFG